MSLPLRNNEGNYPSRTDPGNYPLCYETEQGGILCGECASIHAEPVGVPSNWNLTDAHVNWEDNSIFCDCCKMRIDCAFQSPIPTQVQIGDYFTTDYIDFYQSGEKILTVKPDENWWEMVKQRMELESFWKNVWWVGAVGAAVRPTL